MTLKATLMDEAAVARALRRISFEIVERNRGVTDVCLVGIRRRGVSVASALRKNMELHENASWYRRYVSLEQDWRCKRCISL